MTRGRNQKRHRTLRESTNENDLSQTGQGEENATSPAQDMSPRRGSTEDFTGTNSCITGHDRQNPSINSKNKPISEEDNKEEEEEEEEEITTAKKFPMCILGRMHLIIPNKDLNLKILQKIKKVPESEIADDCDPSKKALSSSLGDKTVAGSDRSCISSASFGIQII
jgi:hypothetical protein